MGGVPEVKAACCTAFAEAKCSDWSAVLGACDLGQDFVGTSSAPPDNADGKTLSSAKYKEMCCVSTWGDFSVAWAASQLLGGGCAEDTKFFDAKKDAVTVAAPAGVTEVKAACCTAFAEAKCSDWRAVLGACDAGQNFVGTNSAPPDNADGKTLSSAKYKEMCCVEPITCASVEITATVTTTVTAATMNDDPIALTVTGSVTLEVNNANEILNDAVTKAGFVSDMIKVVATLAGIGPAYHC